MQKKTNQINKVENLIHVIGTDASGPEKLPKYLQELILSTKKIAAPKRILKIIPQWWSNSTKKPLPECIASDSPSELINWLKKQGDQVIVLASGDPLWFGIGRCLVESLPGNRLVFHPSITSMQLAFARLGIPWQNASWISLHGRDAAPLAKRLQERPESLAILTNPTNEGAKEVRQYLHASGLEESYALWICEQLGHPQERIQRVMPKDELAPDLHPLHIVILLEEKPSPPTPESLPLFGIEDGIFLQHDDSPGLMTKREIRVQLIADLELPKEGVLWDIGAGVGSIGLEALRLRPKLKLLAIEKRIGASSLIQANAKRLFVQPAAVIESEALKVITNREIPEDLCNPQRVVLGGGGIHREKLLEVVLKLLPKGGIVLIPFVTLEAMSELTRTLKDSSCELTISQHQSWRGVPLASGTRLSPTNPVFILKGKVL
ncbi:precorrin-6y C5,15-methyltransferase (decarboxylating) subunit CbiE [Prochlorococcus sp. MIT 1307]|uniref:precorrin-6y C5,15-methyltransferase (decarboxylating) subunit CbiE n=1 Tax=Prochlorococcus sp. MIT 1307 TaxID=3096219 RepID=UPI002A75B01F|nr:precorrin-6y C5,15-methyltransferase (decarboxylating) subunit CbiE [Prochlorococcus sp. MIT 1307]